ncbi:MAG: glutathionylspermidine synthase family protein [Candidatus Eremiobacteraeota bacterium]|nr:glutathionylspermidine synthase family protein [Candidatus Eremiobacteraeota bacterium]
MSILEQLDKEYRKLMHWMVKNPVEALEARRDFQERVIKKRCIHGEEPFNLTLMPLFLKEKSHGLLRDTTEQADRLIDKVVKLYFKDPYVHDYFPYWNIPKEWIDADPLYPKPTVINRHDILYDGKKLKFIEFNTDNPGGIGWTDLYEELFREHPLYMKLIKEYEVNKERAIVKGLMDAILECYHAMNFSEPPRVALVNFRGLAGNYPESEIVRDFFTEHGIEATITDARDFELKEGRLFAGSIKYPIIMRALRAEFYMRYPRDLRDFIKGVTGGAACVINSFRALIGSHKTIHSFLSNPLNSHYFSDNEVKFIKKYIPWTRRLDETVTLSVEGDEVILRSYMLANREKLVIKPSSGAGGYNVMVGKSTPELKWKETVEEYQGDPSWIVQEYMAIPEIKVPVIKKNKIVIESKFFNLSPYCIGGKYVGVLGRVSAKDVINISAGGGIIPVFPLRGNGE